MFLRLLSAMLMVCMTVAGFSQRKISIENAHASYLRNGGTIIENNRIKGYFFLYQSDRIDRHTNEYTLEILDQNVNKVIDIKFEDTRQLSVVEAAYNSSSLAFLFRNEGSKTLDVKIYDVGGKLKYSYSRSIDKRSDRATNSNATSRVDEYSNKHIFDLGESGYASVYTICHGKQISYGVDFYSSQTKSMWTYRPVESEGKYTEAKYLGSTDSVIILRVSKGRAAGNIMQTHIIGVNFIRRIKEFEIDCDNEEYVFSPSNVINTNEQGKLVLTGNYYNKGVSTLTGVSNGFAVYELSRRGTVLSKKYEPWADGNLFMRRLIQSNGRFFVVAEKGRSKGTGMRMMELDDGYNVINSTVYSKANNAAYAFTARDADNSNFAVCFSDYNKSAGYKGVTFNSIRYNGEKFVADKIRFKSRASRLHVLPAKMGSVVIMEYFKKKRKLKLRIQKLG